MVKKAAEATPNHLLRLARKERNWTQKEVADRIGAPQSFNISRWEQGTAFPSTHYIQQLCDLFGKSAKELGLLLEESTASSEHPTEAGTLPIWNVPYRRNPFFTGRKEVLIQLHERLTANGTAALTQTHAISGLGGIGKTQIAVEYAYRDREEYSAVLWVKAANRDALASDFAALASLFHLQEQDEHDQNIVVAAVKRWLAHHQGWLLILDNADDLDLLAGFLPTRAEGHILLTTRAQATGSIAPSIAVEKMEKDEGTLFLLRRAKILGPDAALDLTCMTDRTLATDIVEAMDGLPLALDQSGAYIEETGCSLSEYLELYRTHRLEFLHRRSTLPSDHPEPVATTWALAFLKVEQANPAAADLLRLCAFLDPDAIPVAMITEGAVHLGSALEPVASDPFKLNGALEALRKFSLLRRNPNTNVLTIHRLVQAVLKDRMDYQAQRQWAERAVRAVNCAFPEVTFEVWKRCQQYLPHAQTCAELIERHSLVFPDAARLLSLAGQYLRERALYTQAEPLCQRALAIAEQALGFDHPETVHTLQILARLYFDRGQYAQAEPLYQRVLSIIERAFDPEHSDTAVILNNLALFWHAQGHYVQAESLYMRALAIYEQTLGPDHPVTATTLDNLAHLYNLQGSYAQAELLFRRVLDIREQIAGPEHPDTATTLNNLAQLYRSQGHFAQAEPLYQRALAIREQKLGAEHPRTATIMDNLALLYQNQGRYTQSEPLHLRALAIYEKVSGPTHPDTAIALDGLAQLYRDQGRYAQAEPLYQRALAIREQVLGSEHLHTAKTIGHMALLYRALGQYERARPLYEHASTIFEKVLGLEHSDTMAIRESYACLLEEIEHSTEVAKMEGTA